MANSCGSARRARSPPISTRDGQFEDAFESLGFPMATITAMGPDKIDGDVPYFQDS